MKHSIRRQLAGRFYRAHGRHHSVVLVYQQHLFTEILRTQQTERAAGGVSELQEAVGDDGMDSETFQLRLQQSCSKYNLSLLVMDADSRPVMTFRGDEFIRQQLWQHIFMNTD